ncbi:DNA polymerase subunit gamma-2, mitochondrial [Coregonus clupeaformis]|uniref:DNA polymerase subunit gamma-2, mitochondrial n=1 Tax=Coregonus clupeaformis TaxID=59861 RepID=UPI001E1C7745|nr:DNA polymerase subunit gamma-2, mitochondrial [Coregonus clupeaformis]
MATATAAMDRLASAPPTRWVRSGGQNFQAPPQFGAAQAPAPNGMGRPPFPFNPQAQQPQQPPPMDKFLRFSTAGTAVLQLLLGPALRTRTTQKHSCSYALTEPTSNTFPERAKQGPTYSEATDPYPEWCICSNKSFPRCFGAVCALFRTSEQKAAFGLAETGLCFQPSGGPGCPDEVTQSSLVWFCSPRTTSQWLDYWARHRLQWWRKFALGPSDFSCSDITEEELAGRASRGVKIVYNFPWGPEALETLLSRGDAELLQTHKGARNKLQCRDGRKSVVPYAISVTGNIERGVLAYLYNSIQQVKKVDSKQRLQQRKVLKLHPILSPVKVALDMGRGATVELRQVCEGLLQEFLEGEVAAWPGYLETMPTSMEQLNTKYDEMGVLFTVVISDNTLESGLLQVRSRDTTIKETMHISEVKNFLVRYISAAENI